MVECVPNFSEGRNPAKIDAIAKAIASVPGALMLHRTSDSDHNRSVITFAGAADAVEEAAFRAASTASTLIDLREHRGVHPRVGALDVLPFVPLEGTTLEECVEIAHRVGGRIWDELRIPIYFYEAAARRAERQKLEDVRRGEFEGLLTACETDEAKRPDIGGPGLHPTAGAVIIGARKFLIAFNINLHSSDVGIAKEIARKIRASSGGLPAVKALGLKLESRGLVQISMNLTDYEQTGLATVFEAVSKLAQERGVTIAESELIGLAPREAWEQAAAAFLKLPAFDGQKIVENRIERLRVAPRQDTH
ncbi:MAG TPA: glutamate formimidoyltransferase [Bryobacteraceae bacterium]|jgi:glutamate formiminotransferase/glutamate formiminotransferase/formiminotetrahydrofolate cyclodeaminase